MKGLPVGAIGWLLAVAVLPGCSGGASSEAEKGEPLTIEAAGLPTLGDYLPPLDEGRVEVAPPSGWHVPPRDSRFLARFQPEVGAEYPSIILVVHPCEEVFEVSAESLEKLAAEVKQAESVDKVRPIRIGKFLGVVYRKRGREKQSINKILDRLMLDTVVAGRRYTLELRCYPEDLRGNQPYLFAVADGLRFAKAEGETPAGTEPAAAASKPAPAKAETEPEKKSKEPEKQAEKKPEKKPAKEPEKKREKEPAKEPASKKPAKLDAELEGLEELLN